ncbi:hypothetical protein M422DRAFT_79785, partial [Sphaerobolus stellatus SS14]
GPLLHREVVQSESEVKLQNIGAFATVQCDGWKDISKFNLIAFMFTALRKAHITTVHNVSSERKNAEHLKSLILSEFENLEKEYCLQVIGLCTDASGESRAVRFRILAEMPWLLVANCWAHQVQLVLGDYIKPNRGIATAIDSANEIIKWFNNHSYTHGLLMTELLSLDLPALQLLAACLTRWTAHYCAVRCLRQVELALKSLVLKHRTKLIDSVGNNMKARNKATCVMDYIQDPNMWADLATVQEHLGPLAVAANISSTEGTIHGLHPVSAILKSIEKQWAKADQDLFITCLFLNPFLKAQLFNVNTIPLAVLIGIVRRLYCRIFKLEQAPSILTVQVMEYYSSQKQFSEDAWGVDMIRQAYMDEYGECDPLRVWALLPPEMPLVQLAVQLLNFVPNSASTERVFSTMGDIKTKKRNRLAPQKTRDTAFLKLEICRQHAIDGVARKRVK